MNKSTATSNGTATEPDGTASARGDIEADIAVIDESSLFDAGYYSRVSGAKGDRRELIRHYLEHGEAELLSPSETFDTAFYLHTNPDVAAAGARALTHYIRDGASEGRYPNRKRLSSDAAKVAKSGLFDSRVFARHHSSLRLPGLSDVESYLATRAENLVVAPEFDEAFYCGAYEDVRHYPAKPLLHYIDVGVHESRVTNLQDLRNRQDTTADHFDAAYYLAQLPADEKPDDPLEHFLLHGARRGLDPAADFSLDYYVRRYPDLSGVADPFNHYCLHGQGEGRVARLNFSDWFVNGEQSYDLRKPTVVVASHEASRTGAPLVGLMAVAKLSERYNVVVALGKRGSLEQSFVKHCFLYTVGRPSPLDAEYLLKELKRTYDVAAILLNSVETSEYAAAALYADVPSVALLHEFAEYTLPAGRMSAVVETVDRVIVPAELLRQSLQHEVAFHRGRPANNVVVRPQGYLPHLPPDKESTDLSREQIFGLLKVSDPDVTHIVLGAGYVQMRKGIDLFVQTAAEARALMGDDVRFVWVGAGYEPTADLAYSAWVADMVRRLDLEDHVFFLPPQASLDILFDVADVFYLSSRLDPFPNVVLDAFVAGKAVVCFDRATGVADDLRGGKAYGAAVAYCNVREAAQALLRCMRPAALEEARANVRFAREQYDFGDYVAFIDEQLDIAQVLRSQLIASADRIAAARTFDAEFHDGSASTVSEQAAWRSILDYTARGAKGLFRFNARPGLNEGAYREAAHAGEPVRSALESALTFAPASPAPSVTHRCATLNEWTPAPTFSGRIALHLHLHYSELAADYVELLKAAECWADLFITTTSPQKRLEIQYAFREYELGGVHVIGVPNRGRDIGPLLTVAKSHLRSGDYEVVGHLHGKRSIAVDPGMGDRWRNYLAHTLLGDRDNLRRVLALFEADEKMGLVFAEDRHCVGWGKNKVFAERLAAELIPRPAVPAFPIFPLGTMFWARPAVLELLWRREFDVTSFPVEPVPYDGSILHAIERMLPSIAEAAGHSWCTVYRPGSGW